MFQGFFGIADDLTSYLSEVTSHHSKIITSYCTAGRLKQVYHKISVMLKAPPFLCSGDQMSAWLARAKFIKYLWNMHVQASHSGSKAEKTCEKNRPKGLFQPFALETNGIKPTISFLVTGRVIKSSVAR